MSLARVWTAAPFQTVQGSCGSADRQIFFGLNKGFSQESPKSAGRGEKQRRFFTLSRGGALVQPLTFENASIYSYKKLGS